MAIDYLQAFGVGSGLDTKSLVSALVESERAPKQASLNRRASDVEVKISGTAQLKSALQNLESAFSTLNDAQEFNFLKIDNSAPTAATATFLGSASKGSHVVNITQLAQKSIFVSSEFASQVDDLNSGAAATFSFQVGSGDVQSISLDAGDVSLSSLSTKINELDAGISARVVQVSDGAYRLFLESDETGASNEITVIDDLLDIASNQTQQGLDANLTYNGVNISRSSNQVSDLIEGVNLSLTSTTTSPFVIDVYQDSQASQQGVVSLVDAFNQFNAIMKDLTAVASEGAEGGDFASDSIVRDIQRKMKNLFIDEGSVTGSSISRMSDLGVSIDRNGVFQIDQAKLSSALIDHYGEVKSFFTADTDQQSVYDVNAKGLAGDVLEQINEYLKYDGLVTKYELSNARTAASLVAEEKELDTQMTAIEERYTKQFSAMNAAIAEMNSLKDYLDSQLSSLPFTAKDN